MIFSIVENVSEQEKVQKVLIKGNSNEIATELENIFKELLKRRFPEEFLFAATLNAVDCIRKK